MAKSKLDLIISAKDEASGPLGAIGRALGGLGGIAKGALLGGIAAAGAGIAGLGALLVSSTKDAMAAQEIKAQLAAVLKSTGGVAGVTAEAVNKYADSMSKVTRFDDEAIVSAQNLLLTFTSIGKDVFPQAMDAALDMSQALGIDLNSAVLMIGKSFQDPVGGLTALKKAGVNVTDELKDQIKAIMGDNKELKKLGVASGKAKDALPGLQRDLEIATVKLAEMTKGGKASESQLLAQKDKITTLQEKISGTGRTINRFDEAQKLANNSMSKTQRLEEAQTIILRELKTEFEGSAEAAGQTFGGQLDILKTALGNVKESIGGALLPILDTLAATLGPKLVGMASQFGEYAEKTLVPVIGKVATWLADNLPKAIETAAGFWTGTLQPALDDIWAFITDYVVPAFTDVSYWLSENIPNAMATFTTWYDTYLKKSVDNIYKSLTDPATGLVPALKLLGQHLGIKLPGEFQQFDRDLGIAGGLIEVFNIKTFNLVEFLKKILEVKNIVVDAFMGIAGAGYEAGQATRALIQQFAAGGGFDRIIEKIKTFLQFLRDTIAEFKGWRPSFKGMDLLPGGAGAEMLGAQSFGGLAFARAGTGAQTLPASPARAGTWNVTLNITGGGDPHAVGQAAQAGVLRAARAMGVR